MAHDTLVAHRAPRASPISLPLEPTTLRFCCRGGGTIERFVVLPAGSYLLRVHQRSTECYQAVHPIVTAGDARLSTGVASTPTWAATLVDVPADQQVRVRVVVEGGLHCCGTTTIDEIVLHAL